MQSALILLHFRIYTYKSKIEKKLKKRQNLLIENIFSKMSHIPFLISGGVFSKNIFKDCSQCNYIDGPHDFIDFLKKQKALKG